MRKNIMFVNKVDWPSMYIDFMSHVIRGRNTDKNFNFGYLNYEGFEDGPGIKEDLIFVQLPKVIQPKSGKPGRPKNLTDYMQEEINRVSDSVYNSIVKLRNSDWDPNKNTPIIVNRTNHLKTDKELVKKMLKAGATEYIHDSSDRNIAERIEAYL